MGEIITSMKSGNSEDAATLIYGILNESCREISQRLYGTKRLLECEKNKEAFKKWLAKKEAERKGAGGGKEEKGEEAQPEAGSKTSSKLKDIIAARKKNATIKESNSPDEAVSQKRMRIAEGIKRLELRQHINEAKNSTEKSKFPRELAILKRAYARHHGQPLNESLKTGCQGCSDVMVGIVVEGEEIYAKSEILKKAAEMAGKYDMLLKYNQGLGFAVFGKSLVKDTKLGPEDISKAVDRVSAAFFNDLGTIGVDTSNIDPKCVIVAFM